MEKAKTVVLIGGKEYTLSGYESEEYMHRVAIYVDRTMREITRAHGNLPTNMVAVLAALNIADELLRARGEDPLEPAPAAAAAPEAPSGQPPVAEQPEPSESVPEPMQEEEPSALTEDADTFRGDDLPDPEPFPIKALREQGESRPHRRF